MLSYQQISDNWLMRDRVDATISPSYIAKHLDNMAGLSKERKNIAYKSWQDAGAKFGCDCDSVAMLPLGNIVHYCVDYITKLIQEHNFTQTEELTRIVWGYVTSNYKFSHEEGEAISHIVRRDDTTAQEVVKRTFAEALTNVLRVMEAYDFTTVLTEIKTKKATFNGHTYQGTIDIIERNDDGSYTLGDLKNYNGYSESDEQYWFNQLHIYAAILASHGVNVTGLKVYNPATDMWHTRAVSTDYLLAWAERML